MTNNVRQIRLNTVFVKDNLSTQIIKTNPRLTILDCLYLTHSLRHY